MDRCNTELEAAFGRADLAAFDRASTRFDELADRYRELFGLLEGEASVVRAGFPPMPVKFGPRRRRFRALWRRRPGGPTGTVAVEPVTARSGRHVLR